MSTIQCPYCNRWQEVHGQHASGSIRCSSCRAEFVLPVAQSDNTDPFLDLGNLDPFASSPTQDANQAADPFGLGEIPAGNNNSYSPHAQPAHYNYGVNPTQAAANTATRNTGSNSIAASAKDAKGRSVLRNSLLIGGGVATLVIIFVALIVACAFYVGSSPDFAAGSNGEALPSHSKRETGSAF